jgi:hypothetical protein
VFLAPYGGIFLQKNEEEGHYSVRISMTGLISLFVVVCDFVKSKRSSVAAGRRGGFGETVIFSSTGKVAV